MPYKEKEIKKVYYSIGEVAEQFDVAPSLLRYWETEFEMLRPKKTSKGNRLYNEKSIETIRLIYHLVKEKGFTLEGARQRIKKNKNTIVNELAVLERLKKIKTFLIELEGNL